MGQVICAGIPLVIKGQDPLIETGMYTAFEEENCYLIKNDIFVSNWVELMKEFYETLNIDWKISVYEEGKGDIEIDITDDMFPTIDCVVDVFEEAEKSRENDIWDISFDFRCYSARYGSVPHLAFHRGSEAWLNTYTTLGHMDIMIRKVLENPLGKLVRYGMTTR